MRGLAQHLAYGVERVKLRRLRIELESQSDTVLLGDFADLTHACSRLAYVATVFVDGTHHDCAAKRGRGAAAAGEDVQQLFSLWPAREHPAAPDANGRNRESAPAD